MMRCVDKINNIHKHLFLQFIFNDSDLLFVHYHRELLPARRGKSERERKKTNYPLRQI